jgi:hypothetical protein
VRRIMPCEVPIITSTIQLKYLRQHLRCETHSRMHVQVSYCDGPYDKPDGFRKLLTQMQDFEMECPAQSFGRLFYLALPPSVYLDVLTNIRCDGYPCLDFLALGYFDHAQSECGCSVQPTPRVSCHNMTFNSLATGCLCDTSLMFVCLQLISVPAFVLPKNCFIWEQRILGAFSLRVSSSAALLFRV